MVSLKRSATFIENIQTEIAKSLAAATRVRVAVAYWGDGAVERLGIRRLRNRDVKIVCDLRSGACNPDEVKTLRDALGPDNVLKLGRLHAKVWIIDCCAIVGSSNASANGLAQEATEADGLIEANVYVDDKECVSNLSHWFETKVLRFATRITDDDIKAARARWKIQHGTRPPPEQKTVLEALQCDTSSMDGRNVHVYAAQIEELDSKGQAALEEEQRIRNNNNILCWDVTGAPEEKLPTAGAYVIEFDLEKRIPSLTGVWRILQEDQFVTRNGRTLLLCKEAKSIDGLRLGNTKAWVAAVARAIKSKDFVDGGYLREVGEFARNFLLMPRSGGTQLR
jgi:hypothetical protein